MRESLSENPGGPVICQVNLVAIRVYQHRLRSRKGGVVIPIRDGVIRGTQQPPQTVLPSYLDRRTSREVGVLSLQLFLFAVFRGGSL